MGKAIKAVATISIMLVQAAIFRAQAAEELGTEEFGMTERQLVQSIEEVESLIESCMRDQGFQYFAVDSATVRGAMKADKQLPGVSDEEFVDKYGFGMSTFYTGHPPQDAELYNPGKVGLGTRNVQLYQGLSPADRVAYNRALFGEDVNATFAVAIEAENFSRTGGCTRAAVERVFEPDELKASYYNPKDALINKDPRMQRALREYAAEMREAGFEYDHPDDVEIDILERLAALTKGGTIPIEQMTPSQRAALEQLQDYERRVAAKNSELQEEFFEPVEEEIEREMFSREVR